MKQESLSALMDGELDAKALDALLRDMAADPDWRETCLSWERSAAVMQGGTLLSSSFHARLCERLADEPTIKIHRRSSVASVARRPMLWGVAASVLVALAFTWQPIGQQPLPVATPTQQNNLNDYLAAHRTMVGGPNAQSDLRYTSFQTGSSAE
jgi:negative regulator of sigma E activity